MLSPSALASLSVAWEITGWTTLLVGRRNPEPAQASDAGTHPTNLGDGRWRDPDTDAVALSILLPAVNQAPPSQDSRHDHDFPAGAGAEAGPAPGRPGPPARPPGTRLGTLAPRGASGEEGGPGAGPEEHGLRPEALPEAGGPRLGRQRVLLPVQHLHGLRHALAGRAGLHAGRDPGGLPVRGPVRQGPARGLQPLATAAGAERPRPQPGPAERPLHRPQAAATAPVPDRRQEAVRGRHGPCRLPQHGGHCEAGQRLRQPEDTWEDHGPGEERRPRHRHAAGQLHLPPRVVDVFVPKFTITGSYDLKRTLSYMGVSKIFEEQGELTGISPHRSLKVGKAVHKAKLKMDERGVEVAAGTGAQTLPMETPVTYKLNRPFLMILSDKTMQSVLFLGKLANLSGK
ncbi:translation initiation factor IF-2 isoform X2 [Erinaceus europaeus]|uniref:Translation initiation factor IF-2 isoform X2 n=1 Tax=Erinaceus europaeus TaxID=9365 RepID=A0ABM3WKA1_ERIEU|nr:translation initiation factor IF-2 isoform X2 [Erinaceus europaeus]